MLPIWERAKTVMDTRRLSYLNVETGIGVSHSQLSAWINNDRYPRADIALKLARFLKVSLEWLLTGEDESAVPVEVYRMMRNKTLMETMKRVEKANMRQSNALQAILDAFEL